MRIENYFYICGMRSHNGMRPQDIAILLQVVLFGDELFQNKQIAEKLFVSASEVSESLRRSEMAGLLSAERKVNRQSFMEFLQYGFKYVFPVRPAGMANGIATAHSHPSMKALFESQLNYVWPDFKGREHGLAIEPLYKGQAEAVKNNPALYETMALLDVLRVGRNREIKVALDKLKKIVLHD